jgi:hypothetical protein
VLGARRPALHTSLHFTCCYPYWRASNVSLRAPTPPALGCAAIIVELVIILTGLAVVLVGALALAVVSVAGEGEPDRARS